MENKTLIGNKVILCIFVLVKYSKILIPPPLYDIFLFYLWFSGLNCFQIANKLERKYLLKPYLALLPKIYSHSIKNSVSKNKKICVTFCWPPLWSPFPLSECDVLFEWTLMHLVQSKNQLITVSNDWYWP